MMISVVMGLKTMDQDTDVKELPEDLQNELLSLARQALQCAGARLPLPPLDLHKLPEPLHQIGASFVTLTRDHMLRGCIGALEPRLPLAEDVQQHAYAAALHDLRFPSVREDEVDSIVIEISVLTQPKDVEYSTPEELLSLLSPGIDGVIISLHGRRATFLPQVWERIPTPSVFLSMLCEKAGLQADSWQKVKLTVQTYEVFSFQEGTNKEGSPELSQDLQS